MKLPWLLALTALLAHAATVNRSLGFFVNIMWMCVCVCVCVIINETAVIGWRSCTRPTYWQCAAPPYPTPRFYALIHTSLCVSVSGFIAACVPLTQEVCAYMCESVISGLSLIGADYWCCVVSASPARILPLI
ncbi:hypothetical protein ILYODFUR_023693 [Ilyodon furcidens]|uniref:Uncharacterized protein n=1 Tax=Ilyodon furcidens TaxID=33524 RepID=A0ABV0UIV3_9TELE